MDRPIQLAKTNSLRRTSTVIWPNDNKTIGPYFHALIAGLFPVVSVLGRRIGFPLLLLGAWLVLMPPSAGQSGTWTETGDLITGRWDHTATLLSDGMVLVAGGGANVTALASAELYNPESGTWTETGSLATARRSHTATLLPNGQALVAGGIKGSTILASAELYDPASGTWTETGSLAHARQIQTATLLPNGQVLVTGGQDKSFNGLASAELYDPASGTWTETGSLATSGLWTATGSMAAARAAHMATLLTNGQVLVAGGASGSVSLASAELYDPVTGGSLQLVSAASQLTHGTAGTFDVNLPLAGGGIEGRYGPSRPDIVFTFNNNVTGADSVTTFCGTVAPASVDPNDAHSLLVKLTALSCNERLVTVTLNGVDDDQGNTPASASVTFGLLFGDVNGDGIVNKADVVSIRATAGQHLNIFNFRNDA